MRLRNSVHPFVCLSLGLATWLSAGFGAEVPVPLEAAVNKWIADENHWAYTLTIRRSDKQDGETIQQFDPSQPEDKQWSLVKLYGKTPTESEVRKFREQKLRETRIREEFSLGDLLDLERAVLEKETSDVATYEVPLRPVKASRFPPEKFRVLVDINKRLNAVEHFNVSLRSSFRLKGVASVNSVAVAGDLQVIDERYAPQPARMIAAESGHILGVIKVAKSQQIEWANYRRVKPYRDRFDVKLGDIKALGF